LSHVHRLDQFDRLGVTRATDEQAGRRALPALLAGLQANAQDPSGAASLAQALGKHNQVRNDTDAFQLIPPIVTGGEIVIAAGRHLSPSGQPWQPATSTATKPLLEL
jgi:hypothetical protein